MKVLSFDVGIKNLAYCIIEWNDGNDKKSNLKIHHWNIINLVESQKQSETIYCHCMCANCSCKVKSYIDFNDVKYYFCGRHLAKKENLLSNILSPYGEDKWIQNKNLVCSKCKPEDNKSTRKTYYQNNELNLILCNKHYNSLKNKIDNAHKKVYPIKNRKIKDMTVNNLKYQLVSCLDKIKNTLLQDIDLVLIENQPTFKNPTMKAISDTIYTWFMIRGIVDKEINNASIKDIKFISPSNKLKKFDKTAIDEAEDSKKYEKTKGISIENTKTILASYELKKWIEHILSYDKKDDLADSFLQGWYVLNNHFEDKLYNEWQDLYKDTVIKVGDVKKNINILDLRTEDQQLVNAKNDKTDDQQLIVDHPVAKKKKGKH